MCKDLRGLFVLFIFAFLVFLSPARTLNCQFQNAKKDIQTYSKEEIGVELMPCIVEVYAVFDTMKWVVGTGTIVDKSGVILTNYHVASYGPELEIRTYYDKEYPVMGVLSFDPIKDYAMLIVDIGKSDSLEKVMKISCRNHLKTGEDCFVLGNPMGLSFSLTSGEISYGSGRKVPSEKWGDYTNTMIQFSAPISKGNSGGALVDKYGCLIGIPALASTGYVQNLNFAVPIWTIKEIMNSKSESDTTQLIWNTSGEQSNINQDLEVIPWDKFHAMSAIIEYIMGNVAYFLMDISEIDQYAEKIKNYRPNIYFDLAYACYLGLIKDKYDKSLEVLNEIYEPDDNPYFYYVKAKVLINKFSESGGKELLDSAQVIAGHIEKIAPLWSDEIKSSIEDIKFLEFEPKYELEDTIEDTNETDSLSPIEKLIFSEWGEKGVMAWNLIEGEKTAGEILDSLDIPDIWLVNFLEWLDSVGFIYIEDEQTKSEKEILEDSISTLKNDIITDLFYMGNCWSELGDTDKAIEVFEDGYQMDSTEGYCALNLMFFLGMKGDFEGAVRVGEDALKRDLYLHNELFQQLAEPYVELKEYKKAIVFLDSSLAHYKELQKKYPEDNNIKKHIIAADVVLIAANTGLGDMKSAKKIYKELIEISPEWENNFASIEDWIFYDNTRNLYNQFLEKNR